MSRRPSFLFGTRRPFWSCIVVGEQTSNLSPACVQRLIVQLSGGHTSMSGYCIPYECTERTSHCFPLSYINTTSPYVHPHPIPPPPLLCINVKPGFNNPPSPNKSPLPPATTTPHLTRSASPHPTRHAWNSPSNPRNPASWNSGKNRFSGRCWHQFQADVSLPSMHEPASKKLSAPLPSKAPLKKSASTVFFASSAEV